MVLINEVNSKKVTSESVHTIIMDLLIEKMNYVINKMCH